MINLKRVKALIKKDLLGVFNDKGIFLSLCVIPIIFSIILPLVILTSLPRNINVNSIVKINEFIKNIDGFKFPKDINAGSESLYIIIIYFFLPLFLMIPIIISTIISSSCIVGEKENKTLEGLLYTPLTNSELILGKILSSAIPAISVTLISALIYAVLVDTIGLSIFGKLVFPNLNWIILIFWLNPLILFLVITLIILVSQYVKTSKSAQSISIILIVPLIGSIISQAAGLILLDTRTIVPISILLLVIDLFMFIFIVKKLDKEKYVLNN